MLLVDVFIFWARLTKFLKNWILIVDAKAKNLWRSFQWRRDFSSNNSFLAGSKRIKFGFLNLHINRSLYAGKSVVFHLLK